MTKPVRFLERDKETFDSMPKDTNAIYFVYDGEGNNVIYKGDVPYGGGGSVPVVGGVGETIEPGTQYVVDDVTYTTYTGAEIFNSYIEGSGRNKAAGYSSHAEGQYNESLGSYSHAEGQSNITTESCAHAEGSYNKSTGYSSHTEGQNNQASGYAAHAEGGFTKALENYAHTEGQSTQVKSGAYNGHAEGYGSIVEKPCGHTEGRNTKVITNGECAHAEGDGTTASGNAAHSEGYMTTASGIYAHAEGGSCTASEAQSHAEGSGTTASGTQAHAEGRNTTASGYQSHAEGDATIAAATGSHAEGTTNEIKSGANYSHVEGGNNTVNTQAVYSHTEGRNHTNSALYGHTEGLHNTLATNADCGHAEGRDNTLSNYYTHAEGQSNTASGITSHAEGSNTTASGNYSHTQNDHTTASNNGSTAMGYYTIADGLYQLALGRYNVSDTNSTYAFIIGNGANGNERSDALKVDWNGKIYVSDNNGVDVSGLYVTSNDDGKVLTATYQNGIGTYGWAEGGGSGCTIVTDTSTSLPNKVVIENNHEYRYLNLANANSITISIENVDITKSFYSTVVLHDVTSTDILSNFVSVSQDSVLSNVIFLNEDFVDLSDSNTVEMLFFTNGMANTVMCIAYGYTSASPEPPAPIPDPDINEDKYNVYNLTTGETTIYDDQASAAAYLNANTDTNFDVYMGANVATPVTTRYDTGVYITTDWQNVSNLRKFTCNNKVVEVPEGAFRNSSLTEFIRGNGAGANDSYYVWFLNGCFYGCVNMKSFDVLPPEGVTPPGACQFTTWGNEGVFEGTGLETFVGDEVIDVMGIAASAWGENMFKDCTSLTTVTLKSEGGQDEELPTKMFSGCTALTTINVMDPELVRWASDALEGCSDVTINRHDYVDTSRRTTWDEADKPWGANSVTINTIYDLE